MVLQSWQDVRSYPRVIVKILNLDFKIVNIMFVRVQDL